MSQSASIIKHLRLHPTMDALRKFGCFRLGARIWDLKHQGHKIKSTRVSANRLPFARYELENL